MKGDVHEIVHAIEFLLNRLETFARFTTLTLAQGTLEQRVQARRNYGSLVKPDGKFRG
jgi:hypothetical protein